MSSPIERAAWRARWAHPASIAAALLGLAVVVVFVIQAGLFAALQPGKPPVQPQIATPEQVSASNTSIEGFDRQQQPYQVNAKHALQDKDVSHQVHLEEVTGSFKKQTGDVYDVAAPRGLYDTKAKELELDGGVQIIGKDRFTANMEKAHVSVADKKLISRVPVAVDLKGGGRIDAGGVEISDDGSRILFTNRVKASFKQPAKGDGTP
jgi:lipopolysaccharide export system protein LptC